MCKNPDIDFACGIPAPMTSPIRKVLPGFSANLSRGGGGFVFLVRKCTEAVFKGLCIPSRWWGRYSDSRVLHKVKGCGWMLWKKSLQKQKRHATYETITARLVCPASSERPGRWTRRTHFSKVCQRLKLLGSSIQLSHALSSTRSACRWILAYNITLYYNHVQTEYGRTAPENSLW